MEAAARAREAAASVYEAAQEIRGEEGPSAAADRWRHESAANPNRKTVGSEGAPKTGPSKRRPQGAARVYNMKQEELDAHKTAMVSLLNAGENFDQKLEDVAEDGLLNQTLLDLLEDRMEVCACVCMCSLPVSLAGNDTCTPWRLGSPSRLEVGTPSVAGFKEWGLLRCGGSVPPMLGHPHG